MLKLSAAIAVLMLVGCVTTSEMRMQDGSLGHAITCGGAVFSMADCYRQAGDLCGSHGYTIYDKSGEAIPFATGTKHGMFAGSIVNRSLLVQCNRR